MDRLTAWTLNLLVLSAAAFYVATTAVALSVDPRVHFELVVPPIPRAQVTVDTSALMRALGRTPGRPGVLIATVVSAHEPWSWALVTGERRRLRALVAGQRCGTRVASAIREGRVELGPPESAEALTFGP